MSQSEFVTTKYLAEVENLLCKFYDLPNEYDILQGVIEIIKLLKKEQNVETLQSRVLKVWIQILSCLKQVEDKSNLAYSDPNLESPIRTTSQNFRVSNLAFLRNGSEKSLLKFLLCTNYFCKGLFRFGSLYLLESLIHNLELTFTSQEILTIFEELYNQFLSMVEQKSISINELDEQPLHEFQEDSNFLNPQNLFHSLTQLKNPWAIWL